jgi:REP-associated tyrosine transposase
MAYHALNRGVGRMLLFEKDADYLAFERVLAETLELRAMRLCAYCLMPNHWYLLLWPREDGQLGAFMQRLGITHVRRWQEHRHVVGTGHVYQGRYKSFAVQDDVHFLRVCRYVERNALRAGLVERAEGWRWSSLWRRRHPETQPPLGLCGWPVPRPANWLVRVNRAESRVELDKIRQSLARGRPYGQDAWRDRIVRKLGLENTLRPRGRPKKAKP